MNEDMELSRRTWSAAIKLALVLSMLAALAAVVVKSIGSVPDEAIVATVAVVAFAASWVQTGRVRSTQLTTPIARPIAIPVR
jgi:hypothetical protein